MTVEMLLSYASKGVEISLSEVQDLYHEAANMRCHPAIDALKECKTELSRILDDLDFILDSLPEFELGLDAKVKLGVPDDDELPY